MKTRLLLFLLVATSFVKAQTVSTFAGSGVPGFVNATGVAAQFGLSLGIATDVSGNVYVCDADNHRIRKITPAGVVTTLAGSTQGFADGTGAAAQFNFPQGIVVDASGNVYVADYNNHRIRRITPAGVVTTLAGSGVPGSADGTGVAAQFDQPTGLALDTTGKLYIADRGNNRIRMLWLTNGGVQTIAGSTMGYTDAAGTLAQFNRPQGLVVDASGNIYVSDTNNNRIRKITPGFYEVTTFAGGGSFDFADGTGTAALFGGPWGIIQDTAGNFYVGDTGNNRIRKITPAAEVTTLAGSGTFGYADGNNDSAEFKYPYGIAINSSGDFYVADAYNYRIRKITMTALIGPTISGVSVSSVTSNSATISYSLFANNEATTSVINYGLSSGALSSQATGFSANGSLATSGSAQIQGLSSNTTYYYQIEASNSAGTTTSAIGSFTTTALVVIAEYNFDNTYNNILGTNPFQANAGTSFTTDRHGNISGALNINNQGTFATILGLPYNSTSRTISVWAKTNVLNATINYVFHYGNSANGNGLAFRPTTTLYFANAGANLETADTNTNNTWIHYVCTYDGTTAKVYKNGVLFSSGVKAFNTINNLNYFKLGLTESNGYNYFNGAIDDLKIYNWALNATEISSLYTNNTLTSENFNLNNLEVALYPNPVNDILNIETALDIQTVEFYNIQGQKVLSSNQKQINVSDLAAGMYMVRIQDADNNIATKKIVIK
ncbi:LamG-like jellyroll fold domain-containing protein [Flavobacterium sp.]|uniref:LamG-like jellyroll fold domain-containing protein n=1 Tax=Flavobacterium sp. TaxID=239 RepID=UPI0040471AD2